VQPVHQRLDDVGEHGVVLVGGCADRGLDAASDGEKDLWGAWSAERLSPVIGVGGAVSQRGRRESKSSTIRCHPRGMSGMKPFSIREPDLKSALIDLEGVQTHSADHGGSGLVRAQRRQHGVDLLVALL
jgi:hypothetical protein